MDRNDLSESYPSKSGDSQNNLTIDATWSKNSRSHSLEVNTSSQPFVRSRPGSGGTRGIPRPRLSFGSNNKRRIPPSATFPNDLNLGLPTALERGIQKMSVSNSLEDIGKLQISPERIVSFGASDLENVGGIETVIGQGEYGTVYKKQHVQSKLIMAVKQLRVTMEEKQQRDLLKELMVVRNSQDYPHIVKFYGVLVHEGECWICMELMSCSLDKFYKYVYSINQYIPETVLGRIAVATVNALQYLKEKHKIMHRDVKPSNILINRSGDIKLCDFGISGHLVDSRAQSLDVGCRPYMAPERINPENQKPYDVRTDVWSLGITLYELSNGRFPYLKFSSIFNQLKQVLEGPPPKMADDDTRYSENWRSFVNTCLTKEEKNRPKYDKLLKHTLVSAVTNDQRHGTDISSYFKRILDKMEKPEQFSESA